VHGITGWLQYALSHPPSEPSVAAISAILFKADAAMESLQIDNLATSLA
jgi:hypothetical protein